LKEKRVKISSPKYGLISLAPINPAGVTGRLPEGVKQHFA
jgi:hypothetical protein